jgi:hypothetical protein
MQRGIDFATTAYIIRVFYTQKLTGFVTKIAAKLYSSVNGC